SDKVKTRLGYKAAYPAIEDFVNSSKMIENQENVKSRSDKGYHAVPLPYTRNYIPPKPDIMFIDEQVESESVDVVSNVLSSAVKTNESKVEFVNIKNKGVYSTEETKLVRKNNFSPPIIEDWNSNDESEVEFEPKVEGKTVRPSIEKIKFVKTASITAFPLPYTRNYIPPKPDIMFIDEQVESESVDVVSNVLSSAVKTNESKVEFVNIKNKGVYSTEETKLVRKNNFSPPIIEDWNSNDESEVEFEPKVEGKTVRPSIEKIKFVKTASITATLKSSLEGRVDLLGNHERIRSHSSKGMTRKARVIGNVLDVVILIISLANVQSLHETRIKKHLLRVLGAIAKMKPMTKPMKKLVSWLNRQMR
nr:hypothetical protein [Tanacetum cinerariifolium]